MNKTSFRYLSQNDILSLDITFDDVLSVTERALQEHGRKAFEMPPKPSIHPLPGTFIHAMPAFLSNLKVAGLKWVSGFSQNMQRGLPTIIGLLILNDPETGVPLSVMDATWLTAVRTAAVSGVAAKHLARDDARVLGIVGAGTQGRYNTGMIKRTCPSIQEVLAFDTSPEQLGRFQSHVQDAYGLAVELAPNPQAVFQKSDIVVTATGKQDRPMVERAWLREGGFYIGLESFRYWGEEALLSADKFVTDDWNQAQSFLDITKHIRRLPHLYGELGEIAVGAKNGRERDDERIVCIFIGMALIDIAVGDLIHNLASERTVGTELVL